MPFGQVIFAPYHILCISASVYCSSFSRENQNFSQLTSNTLSQQTRYTVCILPTAAAPQACLSVSNSATFSHMSNSLLYLSMSRRLVAVVKSVPWVRVAPPHRYRSPPTATREAWHRGMRISPRRVHLKRLTKISKLLIKYNVRLNV